MTTYAIGDIQGCFDEFEQLLGLLAFNPTKDHLWLVGDLVNRGPKSLETLRYVKELGSSVTVVLGNHDLHLLAVAEGLASQRPDDTLAPILAAPDCQDLLDWLRTRPMLYRDSEHVLVHAGLLPQWTVDKAATLAAEVQRELRGPAYRQFLAALYGSKPDRWSDELSGADRLRAIVNALTRLRFCSADGVMEFATKGEVRDAPAGYMPWFTVPGRRSADAIIVCGHWSALGLELRHNLLAIDSGCVWGNKLSAISLDDGKLFQVDCLTGRGPAQ